VYVQALTKLRAEHNSGPASAADLPEHRLIEEHWIRYSRRFLDARQYSAVSLVVLSQIIDCSRENVIDCCPFSAAGQTKSNGLFCFAAEVLDYHACKIQERLLNTYKNIKIVKKKKVASISRKCFHNFGHIEAGMDRISVFKSSQSQI